MANEFSNLNGYKCKDATARNLIAGLGTSKVSVDVFNTKVSEIDNSMNQLNEDIKSTNTRFDTFAESVPDAASEISYDNTESGLTATDVQAALNELKNLAATGTATATADKISYDNTESGLDATNVQAAIDKLKEIIPYLVGIKYDEAADMVYIKNASGEWVEWKQGGLLSLVLYAYGDSCVDVSGGWNSHVYRPSDKTSFNAHAPSLTFNDNSMTISLVPESYYIGTVFHDAMVDMTSYSKLLVEVESPSVGYNAAFIRACVVENKKDSYTCEAETTVTADAYFNDVIEVNITNIVGKRYVGLCLQNADSSNITGKTYTVNVKKVWLE